MHRVSRRDILSGGLAASIALNRTMRSVAADQAERPLKDIASGRGIIYGTAVMASQLLAGDSFTDLLVREVAALVPENEMKWQHMSTAPFRADYRMPDYLVDFASGHGLLCRGHNLLWYWTTPQWFKELADRDAARAAVVQRVTDMVSRYRGRVDSWESSTNR